MPFVYKSKNKNLSYVKVYLKTSTKVSKIVPDFAPLTMIAEIGGYTGLLLGVSLVQIKVVVEEIFKRALFSN